MTTNSHDLESQLEQLLINDDDFLLLEKEFDQFCPFEALGMVRSEIRHGNFLAYILNPGRPHGFHTEVLRAFLLAAARSSASTSGSFGLKPLDVHLMDIEQAEVRREWRNIDLLIVIRTERIIIPIELKVESSQGADQLRRYRKIVEDEWPEAQGWRHLNVFLTKYEEEPIDTGHWHPLTISDLVRELEPITEKTNSAQAGASLNAYLKMLRRHHVDDALLLFIEN